MYEVQKAVMIPISTYPRDSPTEELWQIVGRGYSDIEEARRVLQKFRKWNKGKGLHYRLVKVIEK